MNTHAVELEWIKTIQLIRHEILDTFFKAWDFFDRGEFFFILFPLVWLGYSWRWGARLFYLLNYSTHINYILKSYFALPRPCHLDPTIGLFCPGSYGFPSGAATTAMILSGLFIYTFRTLWSWVLGGLFFLLFSFSRVYSGVHFPTDILGGWITGLIILILFFRFHQQIETFLSRQTLPYRILAALIAPLPIYLFNTDNRTLTYSAALFTCGIGLAIQTRHKDPKTLIQRVLRVAIGIGGGGLILWISPTPIIAQLMIGFWLGFIAEWILSAFAQPPGIGGCPGLDTHLTDKGASSK